MNTKLSGLIGIHLLAAALALFLLPQPFTVYQTLVDKGPTWLGLDASARMTLNYAWLKGWNWGQDIIYTYGPLSFLATKVGWGISRWVFLAADLFVVVNFYLAFKDYLLRSANKAVAFLILFLLVLTFPLYFGSGLSWLLLFFMFYWMYKSYERPVFPHFLMLALVVTLAFYIKLNTGLVGVIFFVLHAANLLLSGKARPLPVLAGLSLLLALIVAGALWFNVALGKYIIGALEVMKGYNDLLYLNEDHPLEEWSVLLIFYLLLGGFLYYAFRLFREKNFAGIFFPVTGVAFLYLLMKQAMLRDDVQHLFEFLCFVPLVLLYGRPPLKQTGIQSTILWLTLIITGYLFLVVNGSPQAVSDRLAARSRGPLEYLGAFRAHDPQGFLNQKHLRHIPDRTLRLIGKGTVDVFPWDSEYILEHQLNYAPRPVFQTFQANTAYLEETNYRTYVNKAPEFVLYDYDAIDNCYPFNDAPKLNLFLLQNYTLADTFTSNERWRLLLRRKPRTRPVTLMEAGKSSFRLQEEVPLEQDAEYLKIDLKYNLAGLLKAYWLKPEPLQLMMQQEDGTWVSHKTSGELLRAGQYVKRLVKDNHDFASLLEDEQSPGRITAIRINGNPAYFAEGVGVTWYKVVSGEGLHAGH